MKLWYSEQRHSVRTSVLRSRYSNSVNLGSWATHTPSTSHEDVRCFCFNTVGTTQQAEGSFCDLGIGRRRRTLGTPVAKITVIRRARPSIVAESPRGALDGLILSFRAVVARWARILGIVADSLVTMMGRTATRIVCGPVRA